MTTIKDGNVWVEMTEQLKNLDSEDALKDFWLVLDLYRDRREPILSPTDLRRFLRLGARVYMDAGSIAPSKDFQAVDKKLIDGKWYEESGNVFLSFNSLHK